MHNYVKAPNTTDVPLGRYLHCLTYKSFFKIHPYYIAADETFHFKVKLLAFLSIHWQQKVEVQLKMLHPFYNGSAIKISIEIAFSIVIILPRSLPISRDFKLNIHRWGKYYCTSGLGTVWLVWIQLLQHKQISTYFLVFSNQNQSDYRSAVQWLIHPLTNFVRECSLTEL